MMTELDKWQYTRNRYVAMYELVKELKQGMHSEGNKEYAIPPCVFCKAECEVCDWRNVFGLCRKQGGPGDPNYDRFSNAVKEAESSLENLIMIIDTRILTIR